MLTVVLFHKQFSKFVSCRGKISSLHADFSYTILSWHIYTVYSDCESINFQVLPPNEHIVIDFCRLPVAEGEQCQVKFGQNEIRFHQVNIED